MSLPPRLAKELEDLRGDYTIEVIEDPDLINLLFKGFGLGEGFSVSSCDLLIRVPRSYPDAGPDMFWTNPEVTLTNGQPPQSAEQFEDYVGRRWRRFSWHRQTWNPQIDDMVAYIEFVRRRLREKK